MMLVTTVPPATPVPCTKLPTKIPDTLDTVNDDAPDVRFTVWETAVPAVRPKTWVLLGMPGPVTFIPEAMPVASPIKRLVA